MTRLAIENVDLDHQIVCCADTSPAREVECRADGPLGMGSIRVTG